jgi:AcrR family transcriptional regulator
MGVAERRAREKEAVRSKILEAAGQLFIEEGVENVSIRKIAERAEYSPATLYLYFRDKDELLASLCTTTFQELTTRMEELRDRGLTAIDELRQGMRCYIEFGLEHPNHYLITFNQRIPDRDPNEVPSFQEAASAGNVAFDGLRQCVRRCMDSGDIPAGDVETAAQIAWMFMHGIASLLITAYPDPHFPWVPKDHLIENGINTIVAGLRCHASPSAVTD